MAKLQPHGGDHNVTVVRIPAVPNRLVHFSMDGPNSWKLRDFITQHSLSSDLSHQTAAAILDSATFQESPENVLFRPVSDTGRWTTFLLNRSQAICGPAFDPNTPPNNLWGDWQGL